MAASGSRKMVVVEEASGLEELRINVAAALDSAQGRSAVST
jgi:hypothetical protein